MKNTGCRERGFTLVESLVVVAILFIAMMIAAPFLSKQIQRNKIVGAANQVGGLMRLARLDAIKTSQFGCVTVEGDVIVGFRSADANCGTRDQILGGGQVQLPKNVTASISGFNGETPPVAVFRNDGSLPDPGQVRLETPEIGTGGRHCMQVRVAPAATGRVVIEKWDATTVNDWHTNGSPKAWDWTPRAGSCP